MSKIALCFLTYGNVSQPKLWSNIINSNTSILNIYIHNKHEFIDDEFNLHKYCINNRVATKWGNNSLINATLKLFETSFNNINNKFFILLSDKCVPLYSFKHIYAEIFKSKLSLINECNHKSIYRYNNVKNKEFIKPGDFYKQGQWMCLSRSDVSFFLNNSFLHLFKKNFFALDEHYWICILNKHKRPYIKKNITYTNWEAKKSSPKLYNNITENYIDEIKKKYNTYFIRKISDKCILPECLYFD